MQQSEIPVVAWPHVVFGLFILGLFAASISLWLSGLVLWWTGQQVLPNPEPRRMQRWGLVDLLFTVIVVVGLQYFALASGIALQIGPPIVPDQELEMPMMAWISTVQTLAIVIVTVFIVLRCGVRVSSLGWSIQQWFKDLRLGFVAFIVLVAPVYLLMMVVTVSSGQDYSHPILEMSKENPWMLLPAIFMAVILAPIGEEFAFRVLLQGFLESMSKGSFTIEKLLVGRTEQNSTDETESSLPLWPIFVSGIMFGVVHYSYGMSWIPLSVLGIALGWLYRVTNRIWPSLVVHMGINATSMIGLAINIFLGDPTEPGS
ncbi:MAG: CPBP family intramembrane glutamic endopeptidase [Pirellulaceae bacterium]|nr:CPBP family intramembrane glutamic endopeptidase [Pirellulaceae bacterium]